MSRPTPEKWWAELDDSDRVAFMDAAGVTPVARVWVHLLPNPYLERARAKALERSLPPVRWIGPAENT